MIRGNGQLQIESLIKVCMPSLIDLAFVDTQESLYYLPRLLPNPLTNWIAIAALGQRACVCKCLYASRGRGNACWPRKPSFFFLLRTQGPLGC